MDIKLQSDSYKQGEKYIHYDAENHIKYVFKLIAVEPVSQKQSTGQKMKNLSDVVSGRIKEKFDPLTRNQCHER